MTMYNQVFAAAGRSRMAGKNAEKISRGSGGFSSQALSSYAKQWRKNVSLQKITQHLEEGIVA